MRCDECKYWNKDESRAQANVSLCTAAKQLWNCTEWDDKTLERVLKPECSDMKMFVQDGSDYSASLYTAPDFFCASHKSK